MIGVLVSGEGTNLQALLDAGLPVVAVASNRAEANALERARGAEVAAQVFDLDEYDDRDARDEAMAAWLTERGVELVVCAGYMQLLRPAFLDRFAGRIVNTHSAPLPDFPGAHPIEDVLAAGVRETAATVHYVDEGVDTGAVIQAEAVPVLAGDDVNSLRARVQAVEQQAAAERRPRADLHVIRRALISAYDKDGLEELGKGLAELGVELVASDGTAAFLESLGLEVTRVDELTEVPELLGGRVKTLHPNIHAGILARHDHPDDLEALARRGIKPFDLVCVNLYPFAQIVGRYGVREEEAVEMIDIGGPSMLRGAAKNFAHVIPLCRRERFGEVLGQLREHGSVSLDTRRELAAEAFSATAAYEAAISAWFSDVEAFPDRRPSFLKVAELPYGENPHQRAAYYADAQARRHLLSRVEQVHGKELSFNNLNDLSAARAVALEFTLPACVIVKHANPCGVAVGGTVEEAYERALACDPLSAYGGVVALNRPVAAELGARIAEQFVEVLSAPGYEEPALDALRAKPATRILLDRERRRSTPATATTSASSAGCSSRIATGASRTGRAWRRWRGRRTRPSGATSCSPGGSATRGLERDRAREGPAHPRDRSGADEPRRRGAAGDREGPRAGPRARGRRARVGCVLPVRGRPAAALEAGSARSSSRAARSGTTRWSRQSGQQARRWSSRTAAISGTDPTGMPAVTSPDRRPERADDAVVGEARWQMAGAVLAAMVLTILLPGTFRPGPRWVLPLIEGILLGSRDCERPGHDQSTLRAS